jgi:CBS-domain-containing membrane protein
VRVWDKIKGSGKSPPRVTTREVIWSWIGGFLGIGLLGLLWEGQLVRGEGFMLVGSLGASAVLLYGAPRSPLAQPRNVIGGHVISALVGVTSYKLFQGQAWLASAVAVSTSIALMHLSRTLHPPGGATALIAVVGGEKIHSLGFLYVLAPVGVGATVLVFVAIIVNNIPKDRRYPEFWL